jgi:hypothetical protein
MENPDLTASVEFVAGRIAEESVRSGVPLEDDEQYFLSHLPTRPTNPTLGSGWGPDRYSLPAFSLRDYSFERLCQLAKDAHRHDLETRPSAASEWKFATAVLQLNNHPMVWLLNWAGMKTKSRWDGCLVITIGSLIVMVLVGGIFMFGTSVPPQREALWLVLMTVGAALLLYLAGKKNEHWSEERAVERYRCVLPRRTSR